MTGNKVKRSVTRKFFSYGPLSKENHYYAPRIDLIEKIITLLATEEESDSGHYLTIWAPRQTGKTWVMQESVELIKKTGDYEIAIISMERAKEETNEKKVAKIFVEKLQTAFDRAFPPIKKINDVSTLFTKQYFQKPAILIIDEFDSLEEKFINRFAGIFRDIYLSRSNEKNKQGNEKTFLLHGLALVGVRSVLGIENKKGSPFNVQRSLQIPNLSYDEVEGLFKRYEKESGQAIHIDVIKKVYEETRGQPGLTCWFGELLTETYNKDTMREITLENFKEVYSAATYLLPNINIMNIISKSNEDPYKNIVLEIFQNDAPSYFSFDKKECNYLYMNGVIEPVQEGERLYMHFSSPFLQARLFNYFSNELFEYMGELTEPFEKLENVITPDGLEIKRILELYKKYLNKNKDWLFKDAPRRADLRIHEAVFHFNLYSYIFRLLERNEASIYPEFPTGNGQIDLVIHYRNETYGLELKTFRDQSGYKKALEQASNYGYMLKLKEIHLVFFIEYIDPKNRLEYETPFVDKGVNVIPYFIDTGIPDVRTINKEIPKITVGKNAALSIPDEYKHWIKEFHSILPVDQLAKKGEVVLIDLPAVYISLETANPFYKPEDEGKEPFTIDIEALMGRMNLILLRGDAGMGKTTLIKHLAYSITQGSGPTFLNEFLPVLIFLKDLWPLYKDSLKNGVETVFFESLLKGYFEKSRCPLTLDIVLSYLKQNRALLLIDGLDEIPGDIRGDMVDMIHRFQFEHSENRFLITSRPHGVEGHAVHRFGKYLSDIEFLNEEKIGYYIIRWFRAVSGQATGIAEMTAKEMIADIRPHEHCAVFTRNPLLLTALCVLYLVGGKRIPDQRADLYDRIVGNLLYRRFHDPGDTENVNRVQEFLMKFAFTMQTRNIKCIEPYDAKDILKETYPQLEGEPLPEYKKRIEELFNGIEPVCGLLNRLSGGEIEFSHLSFQEFLAAKHMLDRDIDYKPYLETGWWRETILLYTGLMNLEMKKRSNDIAREILEMSMRANIQLLGAKALRDFQFSKREESVVILARKKLISIIESDASLEERFEAGEILGALGDPRIDVLNPPMVRVEAGEFIRGYDEIEEEKPVNRIFMDEFMIGKYPVTNSEFKEFIEDGGYSNKEFWTPEGWGWVLNEKRIEPGYWRDRKWNGPNFPVVGVSWYEAMAYVKWLSVKIGKPYSLPTEAQWEKAARGVEGFIYPWGNTFNQNLCNSRGCGLNRTSPVGLFIAGRSPYGCMDMSGNVWEWSADWFGEYYYKEGPSSNPKGPEDGKSKISRGGSWSNDALQCRSAIRDWGNTERRDIELGFRVALHVKTDAGGAK